MRNEKLASRQRERPGLFPYDNSFSSAALKR